MRLTRHGTPKTDKKRAPRLPAIQRHAIFIGRLGGATMYAIGNRYTDGGPTDVDRVGRRAKGKRQRQARRLSRR